MNRNGRKTKKSNARGVIPAVFKPFQAIKPDRDRVSFADISYNAAHEGKCITNRVNPHTTGLSLWLSGLRFVFLSIHSHRYGLGFLVWR